MEHVQWGKDRHRCMLMLSIPMLPFPLLQEAVQRTWAELTNCDIILRHPKKAKTCIEEPLKAFCMP